MEQSNGEQWARDTIERVYTNITEERRRQGLSANDLATRCAEVGLPIPRRTLSKMDNHARANISLPELLVIARALRVAPVNLLYSPLKAREDVEYLPGRMEGVLQASGLISKPGSDDTDPPPLTASAYWLLRQLETRYAEASLAKAGLADALVGDDDTMREAYEEKLQSCVREAQIIRTKLQELGVGYLDPPAPVSKYFDDAQEAENDGEGF